MGKLKKIGFISAMTLAFLLVASVIAYATGFLPCPDKKYGWAYLSVGLIILIASGIVAFVVRKNTAVNVVCFFMNSVALGSGIRAWYIFREIDNNFLTMFFVCLACLAYLWLFFALCQIPVFSRHKKLFFWLWLLLSLGAYLAVVILTTTTFVSTFGFYMLVLCAFIYAVVSSSSRLDKIMRALTISAYSVFAVIVIVALTVMSEDGDFAGDAIFDFAGEATGNALTPKGPKDKK